MRIEKLFQRAPVLNLRIAPSGRICDSRPQDLARGKKPGAEGSTAVTLDDLKDPGEERVVGGTRLVDERRDERDARAGGGLEQIEPETGHEIPVVSVTRGKDLVR